MAKVLIDIPDKAYRRISEKSEVLYSEMIILNGTPLTDLANGEVMLEMFPNLEVLMDTEYSVYLNYDHNIVSFNLDWWNRKWGE